MTRHYTAGKSRSEGRNSWTITFRHPLRTDSGGRPGLKVRRGLGTSDEAEADRLVEQMNELLSDERYWSVTARPLAEERFSPLVTDAFYSGLAVPAARPADLRDEVLPYPSREDGYAKVLLVGTTGAGKTTLLRHLIGSDPRTDRFPSTSTGRTTTSDIEVIIAEGPYRAVVTFHSERAVRSRIQECIAQALLASWNDHPPAEVARQLLQHPDQTFRLNYTLGNWTEGSESDDDGWGFQEDPESTAEVDAAASVSESEQAENQSALEGFVQQVMELADRSGQHVTEELSIDWAELKGAELDAAEAMIVDEAESRPEHTQLTDSILSAVLKRFEAIDRADLVRTSTGWPSSWQLESGDRESFLERVRWFTSNYAPRFGQLLTPLVQGIRVSGPFFPTFGTVDQPKLVLIDGQGLGHVAESSDSVTTKVTGQFESVDAVVLVDSAQQPMQAAPLAALRALAVAGHQEKVLIAFTHFDLVKGPNLRTPRAKQEHVVASVRNTLNRLRTEIGDSAIRALDRELEERCFMLGWMDAPTERLPPKVVEGLRRLVGAVQRSIQPAEPIPVIPVYDPASLMFAVQAATMDFHQRWNAKLGFGGRDGERKEHWTRVKALNRRIADRWDIEYDTLTPVADLTTRLSEEISDFLERPVEWQGDQADDEDQRARAVDSVRRSVSAVVHRISLARLIDEHLQEWVTAYSYSGTGSTFVRARDIRNIYEEAAPVPGKVVDPGTREFLDSLRHLVGEAIAEGGGKVLYEVPTRPRPVTGATSDS